MPCPPSLSATANPTYSGLLKRAGLAHYKCETHARPVPPLGSQNCLLRTTRQTVPTSLATMPRAGIEHKPIQRFYMLQINHENHRRTPSCTVRSQAESRASGQLLRLLKSKKALKAAKAFEEFDVDGQGEASEAELRSQGFSIIVVRACRCQGFVSSPLLL